MFEKLLAAIARALEDRHVPYMVVGGQAVLLHGEPRLTRDIDITLGLDVDGLPTILDAASAAHLNPLVDSESFTRQTMFCRARMKKPESGSISSSPSRRTSAKRSSGRRPSL